MKRKKKKKEGAQFSEMVMANVKLNYELPQSPALASQSKHASQMRHQITNIWTTECMHQVIILILYVHTMYIRTQYLIHTDINK